MWSYVGSEGVVGLGCAAGCSGEALKQPSPSSPSSSSRLKTWP